MKSNGLLYVYVRGDLYQQMRAIANSVVIARILNATLVVPILLAKSSHEEISQFGNIFSEEHFIETLKDDVNIFRQANFTVTSDTLEHAPPDHRTLNVDWYLQNVAPVLQGEGVAVLDHFLLSLARDLPEVYQVQPLALVRLANSTICTRKNEKKGGPLWQRLRCRVLYHALLFTSETLGLGANAVERLHAEGPYVALHLSFQDRNMLRSTCVYDSETAQMIQEWFATHHIRVQSDSGAANHQKLEGLCPLSPNEVTRILQAISIGNHTNVYVGGSCDKVEQLLTPLRSAFPGKVVSRCDLLDSSMAPISSHLMQAIDYIVSLESDFFMTNKRSSIAVLLRGHRFYMGAQKETYQPFVPALLPALAQGAAGQEELRQRVREHRKQVAELPIKSSRWHFYDRPWECVCH
ncbi:unnamed protein product [Closterium sp. NIES-53]